MLSSAAHLAIRIVHKMLLVWHRSDSREESNDINRPGETASAMGTPSELVEFGRGEALK